MQVWEMTPKQYLSHVYREVIRENGLNIRSADDRSCARDCATVQFEGTYFRSLYATSEAGNRATNAVMDALPSAWRFKLQHDFPELYRGYMAPDVRAGHDAREREMIEARKRGLLRAQTTA